MLQSEAIDLTSRQQEVIDLLDRRVLIKDIAGRLGISESRVNHYIRELKRKSGANSLPELVAKYRAGCLGVADGGCRKPASGKNELPPAFVLDHQRDRVDEGVLELADASPVFRDAPFVSIREPQVVPGMLDGSHAAGRRLLAIIFGAVGLLAGLLVIVTVALVLSGTLSDVADVPGAALRTSG